MTDTDKRFVCPYCNDGVILDKSKITHNLCGWASSNNPNCHDFIDVQVCDRTKYISAPELENENKKEGYIQHVRDHPGVLRLESAYLDKHLQTMPYYAGNGKTTIDIEIKYCPFCGRKLGKQ